VRIGGQSAMAVGGIDALGYTIPILINTRGPGDEALTTGNIPIVTL